MVWNMARVRGSTRSPEPDWASFIRSSASSGGTAQVHHLAGRPGQRLAGARAVAALPCRVGGDDEVLLRRRLHAHVVRHPAGEDGEVGGDAPQAPLEMGRMVIGEHAAHLVELPHDRLALESAAAGGVPGTEHLHGALQFLDLLRPDGGGLVAVEPGGLGAQGIVQAGASAVRAGSVCSQSCMALLSAEPAVRAAPAPTRPRRLSMRSIPVNSVRTSAVRSGAHGIPSGCSALPARGRFPVRPCRTRPRSSMVTTRPRRSVNRAASTRGTGSRGISPMSIHRRTREVSVASCGWPMAAACRLTSLASSPLDQSSQAEQVREPGVGLSAHVKPPGSRLS